MPVHCTDWLYNHQEETALNEGRRGVFWACWYPVPRHNLKRFEHVWKPVHVTSVILANIPRPKWFIIIPLLPIFDKFPCVHHSINCSIGVHEPRDTVKVSTILISRFCRTYLKSRVSEWCFEFQMSTLDWSYRVILDRWKTGKSLKRSTNCGDKLPTNTFAGFSPRVSVSVKPWNRTSSNLWKSSQHIISINLL